MKYFGFICFVFLLTACGGSSSTPEPPETTPTATPTSEPTPTPMPTESPGSLIDVSNGSNVSVVGLPQDLFDNLATLAASPPITLTSSDFNGQIKAVTSETVDDALFTPTVLTKHPDVSSPGELCLYTLPAIVDAVGTVEFDVTMTGELTGVYTVSDCDFTLNFSGGINGWSSIYSQAFGPAEALEVFFNEVKIAGFLEEETSVLYVGSFLEDYIAATDKPFVATVLANEEQGVVCLNFSALLPEYVSYYTPKVVVGTNLPTGFSSGELSDVNKPIAFLPNCLFSLTDWDAIWDAT